jgi:hypothetical protein
MLQLAIELAFLLKILLKSGPLAASGPGAGAPNASEICEVPAAKGKKNFFRV